MHIVSFILLSLYIVVLFYVFSKLEKYGVYSREDSSFIILASVFWFVFIPIMFFIKKQKKDLKK